MQIVAQAMMMIIIAIIIINTNRTKNFHFIFLYISILELIFGPSKYTQQHQTEFAYIFFVTQIIETN